MRIRLASIGASGALYGILFFFIVERLITMKRQPGRRMLIFVQLVVLVIVPTFVTMTLVKYFKYRVAHSVHFGGALVGFLTVLILDSQARPIVRWISFAIIAVYFALTTIIFFLTDAPFIGWISYYTSHT